MRMRKSPSRVRSRWKEQDCDGKVLETDQTTGSTYANGKGNTCRIARKKTIVHGGKNITRTGQRGTAGKPMNVSAEMEEIGTMEESGQNYCKWQNTKGNTKIPKGTR